MGSRTGGPHASEWRAKVDLKIYFLHSWNFLLLLTELDCRAGGKGRA